MAELEDERHQRLFCEIVAQLLIADAQVTDAERDFIHRLFDRFGFDEAQRQAVYNSVNIAEPIDRRLKLLPKEAHGQLLADLEMAAALDGSIGAGERQIIEDVRRILG
jgi:uncharacterized membrane protein YebE (DUF533 family)